MERGQRGRVIRSHPPDDNKEKWGEGAGIGAQCCGPAIASGKGGTVLGWAVRAYLLGRPDPEERRDGRHSGAARAVSGLLFGKCNAGSRASSFNSRQIRTRGRLSGHDPYQGTALRPYGSQSVYLCQRFPLVWLKNGFSDPLFFESARGVMNKNYLGRAS